MTLTPGSRLARRTLLVALAFYRAALSPHVGSACRFWPSCSAYAEQAIRDHGAVLGMRLTLGRLLRCVPWGGRGVDPVPSSGRR